MGAGASSPKISHAPSLRKTSSIEASSPTVSTSSHKFKNKLEETFLETVFMACSAADHTGQGTLDPQEFINTLHSSTINLNLSSEEADEYVRAAGIYPGSTVKYEEVIPITKRILMRVYQKKADDWNDWCEVSRRRENSRSDEMQCGTVEGSNPSLFIRSYIKTSLTYTHADIQRERER